VNKLLKQVNFHLLWGKVNPQSFLPTILPIAEQQSADTPPAAIEGAGHVRNKAILC